MQEVKIMDKKCSKYEGLFVFSDEETLNNHIAECEDCKAEHEKMQKVSDLLGEVKFYYRSQNNRKRKLKVVCALAMLAFLGGSFGMFMPDDDLLDSLMYGQSLSAEELGFPVDSCGLIMVDDEF